MAEPVVPARRHSRLNAVAAWIGIVAGSVFIVGAIFFSGFFMGLVAGHGGHGHHHGGHRGGGEMVHHQGPGLMFPGPMFRPGPGMFPGGPGWPGGFQGGQGGQGGQGPTGAPTPPGR